MEIPVINRIGEFDVGLSSINEASIFSQIFTVYGIGKLHLVYSFWKWGALIIAFLASFTTLINRIKLLFLRLRKIDASVPLLQAQDDYDSEIDESCSSSDEEIDEEEEQEEEEEEESTSNWRRVDEDFRVRGSGFYLDDRQGQSSNFNIRRRSNGSFPDLPSGFAGSCVVKLWEHLDDRYEVVSSIGKCRVVESSPSVVLTAEKYGSNGVEVRAWDIRAGFRVPALLAEWSHPSKLLGKFIAVETGLSEKLYLRDDLSGEFTVRDMRKVSGRLTNVTESDVDTWWDADGVSVPDLPLRQLAFGATVIY